MPKTIIQTVNFRAKPETLFALYADSKKHSAATGAPAMIHRTTGGACKAFDGSLTGITLGVVPKRVFVQTWRAEDWTPEQADSFLTLIFEKNGSGGRITMIHANIPDEHYDGIKKGWTTYYWAPWKKYLSKKQKRT